MPQVISAHDRTFRKGYLKLHVTRTVNGVTTEEKGGWVDSETGHLTAVECSCGETSFGWSKDEALKNLDCDA